jgi:hypothetical protein
LLPTASQRFAHFSTIRPHLDTLNCIYYACNLIRLLSLEVPLNYKTPAALGVSFVGVP